MEIKDQCQKKIKKKAQSRNGEIHAMLLLHDRWWQNQKTDRLERTSFDTGIASECFTFMYVS